MIKVLITGTNGYIGNQLTKKLQGNITCINRQICDLTNTTAVDNFFNEKYFDIVIHCAMVGGSRLKIDTDNVFYDNVLMFLNLVKNRNSFGRLIHFGSGAQYRTKNYLNEGYGCSKRIIASIINELDEFYNIVIYGLFDENEISTRFIKSCVNSCLNNNKIEVHENKVMDFFHMDDLVTVVEHYINDKGPNKSIECCYDKRMTLKDIAYKIRDICKSDVDVDYTETELRYYAGENTDYINNIISGNFLDRLEENVNKLIEMR